MESVDCKDDKRVNAQESSVVSVDTNGIFFLLDYNTRYYYSNWFNYSGIKKFGIEVINYL